MRLAHLSGYSNVCSQRSGCRRVRLPPTHIDRHVQASVNCIAKAAGQQVPECVHLAGVHWGGCSTNAEGVAGWECARPVQLWQLLLHGSGDCG